jgi:hypothetical protein
MKRLMVLMSVVLIFSMVSFVSAECTDSDGGKNYFVKGVNEGLNSYSGPQIDFCFNFDDLGEIPYENLSRPTGTGVIEHYCDSSDNVANEGYECSDGCNDGACIKIQSCSDTDGGNDAFNKGEIIAHIISSTTGDLEKVESTDSCVGDGVLDDVFVIEHYCIDDGLGGQNYNSVSVRCQNGCSNGACIGEPSDIVTQSPKCIETDSGIDLYTKGSISGAWLGDINGPTSTNEDVCSEFDTKSLQEFTCELVEGTTDTYGIVQTGFDCLRGCKNGACIPISCDDSDGGEDYYNKGFVRIIAEEIDDIDSDTCINENILAEQSCDEGQQKITFNNCAGGCSNGACKQIELTPEDDVPSEIPNDEIIEKDENTSEKVTNEVKSNIICNGCELENKCYPFGYRKSGDYCSESNIFTIQLEADSVCENNFECDSNLCINDECVSGSLWTKFIRWFSRLFGGE